MTKPVVVITGGGQGMGRATALHFAKHQWDCVLIGRTGSKLLAVKAEVEALGGAAQTVVRDLTDVATIASLANEIERVDCLVNGAGESLIKTIGNTTLDDWEKILNTNLRAPFFVTQALLPHLLKSDNPSVLNIGSMTTFGGYADVVAYTASKTGLLGLTRSMAGELRPQGVRVAMLAPGPADTPMRWAATPDYDRKLLIEANTIAETIYWMANLPRHVTTSEFLLKSNWIE